MYHALISGQRKGGGVILGNLRAFVQRRFTNIPTQKQDFFKRKTTNVSPLRVKKCALQNQKVNYFKWLLLDIIIRIRVTNKM